MKARDRSCQMDRSSLELKDDRKQNFQDIKKALKKSLAKIFSVKEPVS